MTSQNIGGIGSSRYRQLRVTMTQELSGNVSYSVYAKRLESSWKEQDCIVRGRSRPHGPIRSTEDAIGAILDLLREELLPGIG